MSRRRKTILIIAVIALIVGACIMSYPYFSQWLYDKNAEELIGEFDDWRRELLLQSEEDAADDVDADGVDVDTAYLQELYAAMQAYNIDLYENGQAGFNDAWSYQHPSFDLTAWGLPDNMVGYIDIPQMGVTLPIYLGASEENMRLGAVHLSQTSLPIGGENTNAVIAAHRGYSGAAMFRNIENLNVGDEITLTNFWEEMTYKVVQIKIIEPTDTDEVLIQEGRDMVTLITCHPYRVNTQRYVVYCEREI